MHVDIFFVMFLFGTVHGQDGNCSVKNALVVPLGNNATFEATYYDSFIVRFSSDYKTIFEAFVHRGRILDFRIFDPGMKNRTTVITDITGVKIIVANLSTKDNGTYNLQLDGMLRNCWFLYVMDLQKTPSGPITEYSAARIYGKPLASLIVRPFVKTTMVWLVDGFNVNQSSDLLVFDGVLWIRNVGRHLHGRNVTYRAVHESGKIDEVNITLDVTYGPNPAFPLYFTPEDTYYTLKSGDTLQDISCHASCNPACEVTWGNHSSDNTLRQGHVSARAARKYTCVAKSSLSIVSRSLYLFVVDDSSTTAALVAVGSIQACTTLVLGICGLLYCFRKRGMSCLKCMHHNRENLSKILQRKGHQCQQQAVKKREKLKGKEVPAKKRKGDGTELVGYEELDLGRGKLQLYDQAVPEKMKKKEKKKLKVYANTVVA